MATAPGPLIGWPLLPVPDSNGRLDFRSLEQSVRDMIQVVLCTRPGEQLMRPVFGAGLQDFVHEPNTLTVRRRVRDSIQDALARWETRIIVDRIDVSEQPGDPSQLRVEIGYRLRRTGAVQTAGVTLQVGSK
jgi:phage baseplate assembly protein W